MRVAMTVAAQLGAINRTNEMSIKAREFINLARCIALSRGNHAAAQAIVADNRILCGPTVKSIIESHHQVYQFAPEVAARQKAAVAAGTTADTGWALPLSDYQTLAAACCRHFFYSWPG
jgi:hypothetical protein